MKKAVVDALVGVFSSYLVGYFRYVRGAGEGGGVLQTSVIVATTIIARKSVNILSWC